MNMKGIRFKMKEQYQEMEIEIIEFEVEDVITTSNDDPIPTPEVGNGGGDY